MVVKNPRFKVSFGYVCPNGNDLYFGKTEEKLFTFKDIEFFLKVMSPFNSLNWIENIKTLNRGGIFRFSFTENCNQGEIKKVIKIERN